MKKRVLSRATNAMRIYSLYLMALGGFLMLMPNAALALLGQPRTEEPWLRVAGAMVIPLGVYCWRAAQAQHLDFFRWSVETRFLAVALLTFLVAAQFGPPVLLLFAIAEAVFAFWTWTDLRVDDPRTAPQPSVESLPARRRHDSPSEV